MFESKKYSSHDSALLKQIYDALEEIKLPTVFCSKGKGPNHAEKTGCTRQKDARQCVFGSVKRHGTVFRTAITRKNPHIFTLMKKFVLSHKPDFRFTSVQVNRNCVCKKHIDGSNRGVSLLVGFGPYTHGRTILFLPSGEKRVHIRTRSLIFDGSKIYHASEPFRGKRYSLVFFK